MPISAHRPNIEGIVMRRLFFLLAASLASAAPPAKVEFTRFAEAPGYSEGPTWRKGEVFFCSGALLRVQGGKVHKRFGIGPAGTVLAADGSLLVCDNRHRALLRITPDDKVEVLADQCDGQALRSLNDLTVDARGNVWWTDPEGSSPKTPIGRIHRLRPDGRVDIMASNLAFPNGLDVDPAGRFLYVIESQTQRILRYAIPADDKLLGKPELFYDLGGSGGDGCAFDAEGNLWVADFHRKETGKGRITVLTPDAEVFAHYDVPAKVVSNICFGGPDHDEIFCTTGDPPGVFHSKVGVKGFAGHAAKLPTALRTLNLVPMTPHADASTLAAIAKAAATAKLDGGKIDQSVFGVMADLAPIITDPKTRDDVNALLPAWNAAATRHASDRVLLAEVKRLGGKATLETGAPDWLRAAVGDDALASFARIVEIDLNERTDGHKVPTPKTLSDRVTDEWLQRLADQTELRRLELSGTAVTSAGLVHLKRLVKLQRLNVCLTAVSDDGFEHLAGLTEMRRMVVCASKITGSGFRHLSGMTKLESINLHSSPASDEGLEAIGKLTSLRRLEIVHTHVTDAGLVHLAGLTNLRQLHVHGPKATGAGLPYLGKLTELYELDIYDKSADNAVCERIAGLPKLRKLMLVNGVFDDAGVKHLSKLITLEELSLNSAELSDASVDTLGSLKNLRKLRVGGKITAAGRQRLKELLPDADVN